MEIQTLSGATVTQLQCWRVKNLFRIRSEAGWSGLDTLVLSAADKDF